MGIHEQIRQRMPNRPGFEPYNYKTQKDATSFSDVIAEAETDKAILCCIENESVWIPKSQIDAASEVLEKGDRGDLMISKWIAQQKGIFE